MTKKVLLTLVYLLLISAKLSAGKGIRIQIESDELDVNENIAIKIDASTENDVSNENIEEESSVEESDENKLGDTELAIEVNKPKWTIEECQKLFCTEMTRQHNVYRNKHRVGELKIDSDLVRASQLFAEELATQGKMYHSKPAGRYGENVFFSTDNLNAASTLDACTTMAKRTTDMWYNEVMNYNYTTGRGKNDNDVVGHFTQIVWKSTTNIGCGIGFANTTEYINAKSLFAVARYSPPGNFMGAFTKNVFPPL